MLPLYLPLALAVAMVLGPVVQELISTNPRLNCNLYFFFPLFKSIFGKIFCVLFKASNSHILDKKKFDWIFFKNFQIWNQISHLQPGPGFIQERIKSFSLLFVDLTPKTDYGYKASLCSSLAVISSQAWSQHMNITFNNVHAKFSFPLSRVYFVSCLSGSAACLCAVAGVVRVSRLSVIRQRKKAFCAIANVAYHNRLRARQIGGGGRVEWGK